MKAGALGIGFDWCRAYFSDQMPLLKYFQSYLENIVPEIPTATGTL